MDHTIRNVSELEQALANLSHEPVNNVTTTDRLPASNIFNAQQQPDIRREDAKSTTASRTSSNQYSSNTLLYNLSGLQTTTNNKLDSIADGILRMQQTMQNIYEQQVKQTELLATIARNTTLSTSNVTSPNRESLGLKTSNLTVKSFGFTNAQSIVSELIIKLLKRVEIQIHSRGRRYRSTRVMEPNMISKAVKVACDNGFKELDGTKSSIKMPDNKNEMTLRVASKIGAVDGLNPVLDANALRELFNDPECRSFMSIVQDIMERIKIVRIMIPFYEADMVNAISFPYFDSEGQVICDWNKIIQRSETPEEAAVITTSITNREKIGSLIARGIGVKAAIRAVIKDSSK